MLCSKCDFREDISVDLYGGLCSYCFKEALRVKREREEWLRLRAEYGRVAVAVRRSCSD